MTNKTLSTMTNVAVKKENGRVLFSEARPKLRYTPKAPLATYTPADIESRIRHNLHLIRITRGDS